jgi:hypothetical protein
MEDFPPLVIQANALARQVGFALTIQEPGSDSTTPSCCLPGVGRLLAVLAGIVPRGANRRDRHRSRRRERLLVGTPAGLRPAAPCRPRPGPVAPESAIPIC